MTIAVIIPGERDEDIDSFGEKLVIIVSFGEKLVVSFGEKLVIIVSLQNCPTYPVKQLHNIIVPFFIITIPFTQLIILLI